MDMHEIVLRGLIRVKRRMGWEFRRLRLRQFVEDLQLAVKKRVREEFVLDQKARERALHRRLRHEVYYAQVPVSMFRSLNSRGKSQEIMLYLILHSLAPNKTLRRLPVVANVSEKTLGTMAGMSEDNARRWLKSMEKKGWVQIIRRGKMVPNTYRLLPVGGSELDGYEGMERIQVRLQRDYALASRLRKSLYQGSDPVKVSDHPTGSAPYCQVEDVRFEKCGKKVVVKRALDKPYTE
jgi:hypothetical protein